MPKKSTKSDTSNREFKLELENDILRSQLSGIKMEMRRWVEAIDVDEDGKIKPVLREPQLLSKMKAFLQLHRVQVLEMRVLSQRKHFDLEGATIEVRVELPKK